MTTNNSNWNSDSWADGEFEPLNDDTFSGECGSIINTLFFCLYYVLKNPNNLIIVKNPFRLFVSSSSTHRECQNGRGAPKTRREKSATPTRTGIAAGCPWTPQAGRQENLKCNQLAVFAIVHHIIIIIIRIIIIIVAIKRERESE